MCFLSFLLLLFIFSFSIFLFSFSNFSITISIFCLIFSSNIFILFYKILFLIKYNFNSIYISEIHPHLLIKCRQD